MKKTFHISVTTLGRAMLTHDEVFEAVRSVAVKKVEAAKPPKPPLLVEVVTDFSKEK